MELCLINVNISIILSKIKLVLDSRMTNSTLYYQKEIIVSKKDDQYIRFVDSQKIADVRIFLKIKEK